MEADRILFNEVTKNLTFSFVQIFGINLPQPPPAVNRLLLVIAVSPPIENVLSIYESTRGDNREIYITFNIENAVPPLINTGRGGNITYGIQIQGITPALFDKYVRLFSIFLLRNDLDPEFVGPSWSVLLGQGPGGPIVTGGLYIAFQTPVITTTPFDPYDFDGQMVIISFNAIATSATYVDNPLPIATANIVVTVTSEIFTSDTQTFVGTMYLAQVTNPSFVPLDHTPFHRFVPYWGYPDPQMIALTGLNRIIREFSHTRSYQLQRFQRYELTSPLYSPRDAVS